MTNPTTSDTLTSYGITPPKAGNRTTCPECSDFRVKRDERCLKIKNIAGCTDWYCFHCSWNRELADMTRRIAA